MKGNIIKVSIFIVAILIFVLSVYFFKKNKKEELRTTIEQLDWIESQIVPVVPKVSKITPDSAIKGLMERLSNPRTIDFQKMDGIIFKGVKKDSSLSAKIRKLGIYAVLRKNGVNFYQTSGMLDSRCAIFKNTNGQKIFWAFGNLRSKSIKKLGKGWEEHCGSS